MPHPQGGRRPDQREWQEVLSDSVTLLNEKDVEKNVYQGLTLTLSASSTCVLASHIHLLTELQLTVLVDHP